MGFVGNVAVNTDRAQLFETRKDGYGNSRHTGSVYNGGYDWDEDPDALWDLLEYLKTL